MDAQNYRNVCPKVLIFEKKIENARKILLNPRTFFVLFYNVQKEDAKIKI